MLELVAGENLKRALQTRGIIFEDPLGKWLCRTPSVMPMILSCITACTCLVSHEIVIAHFSQHTRYAFMLTISLRQLENVTFAAKLVP